jgi:hypothetical protein
VLWHNPMKGYGAGTPTSLISTRGQSPQAVVLQAVEKKLSDESD